MKVKVVFANTPFAVKKGIDLNRVYDADKVFEPITGVKYYITLDDGSVVYVNSDFVHEVLKAYKPEPTCPEPEATRPEPEFVFGIGRKPEIDSNSKTDPEMKEKEMNSTVKVKVLENFATTLIYGLDFEEIYDATFNHKDTNGLKWYTINTDIAVYTISSQNLKIIEVVPEKKTVKIQFLNSVATEFLYNINLDKIYDARFDTKVDGVKWYSVDTGNAVFSISSANFNIIEDTAPSEDFLLHNGELLRIIGTVSATSGESLGFAVQGHVISAPIVVQDYTRVRELSIKDMVMLKDAAPIIVFQDGETIYRHYYAYNKSYNNGDDYQEILTYADGCTSHTTSEYEHYDPSDVKFFEIIQDETNDVG